MLNTFVCTFFLQILNTSQMRGGRWRAQERPAFYSVSVLRLARQHVGKLIDITCICIFICTCIFISICICIWAGKVVRLAGQHGGKLLENFWMGLGRVVMGLHDRCYHSNQHVMQTQNISCLLLQGKFVCVKRWNLLCPDLANHFRFSANSLQLPTKKLCSVIALKIVDNFFLSYKHITLYLIISTHLPVTKFFRFSWLVHFCRKIYCKDVSTFLQMLKSRLHNFFTFLMCVCVWVCWGCISCH